MVPVLMAVSVMHIVDTKVSVLAVVKNILLCLIFSCIKKIYMNVMSQKKEDFGLSAVIRTMQ